MKEECPHLKECKQLISKTDSDICTSGFPEFDFEDCFKFNDLQQNTNCKTPKEWEEVE